MARPPCVDVRGGVQRRKRQASTHCVIGAATAWQSTSGPDPVLFTLSGGAFGCSGIAAKDPAWRRPSWCGGVRLFVLFQRRVTRKFFDDYKSVEYGWVLRYCFDFIAVFEWSGVASFEYSSSVAVLPR